MLSTSDLYKSIYSGQHITEVRVSLGDSGRLITKDGEAITFGGVSILTDSGGVESAYPENMLISAETEKNVFSGSAGVGGCVAGEISVEMISPSGDIGKNFRIVPYVRITDGQRYSEWLQKGVFWADEISENVDSGVKTITIHGYDSLLYAEKMYPSSNRQWPALDVDVVREIADYLAVGIDERTFQTMSRGYRINYPAEYTCREVLGYIAAMYAGNFTMNDSGDLLLVPINSLPKETRYLIDHAGYAITFGGDRINV